VSFTNVELETIDSTVGALCRESIRPEHAHQLRFAYQVDGHSVTLYEERTRVAAPDEWIRIPVARFRFFRSRQEWLLYWMPSTGAWDFYEGPRRRLATLVGYVENDEHGCFFG